MFNGFHWFLVVFGGCLECRKPEFAGDEVEHGGEVFHGSEPSGATLHRAEHTVQPLHEGIGDPVFPVGQNAGHVFLHRAGKLLHL
jgi:hypothetical protein